MSYSFFTNLAKYMMLYKNIEMRMAIIWYQASPSSMVGSNLHHSWRGQWSLTTAPSSQR